MIHDCLRWEDWKAAVAFGAREVFHGEPLLEALVLHLLFTRTRPKSHFGTGKNAGILKASAPDSPSSKPDLTKLVRAVEDSLTGIVWKDDAQVVEQWNRKEFGASPGVLVQIFTIKNH